jgi:PAS domain-containing protein
MSTHPTELERLSDLRLRALSRLTAGARPVGERATVSTALKALYDLAVSPLTAGDALAILHELQVHQVELEVQQEELRNSRADLEAALGRQIELYDRAPVAYLTVDAALRVHEVNQTGARLLDCERDELLGQALGSFLAPRSADSLHTVLAHTRDGQPGRACTLQVLVREGPPRSVQAVAGADAVAGRFLLALMAIAPADGAPGA